MPDTTPSPTTDAEQTARNVIKRWHKWNSIIGYAGVIMLFIWFLVLVFAVHVDNQDLGYRLSYGTLIGFAIWSSWIRWVVMRSYVRRLSSEERTALQTAVNENRVKPTDTVKELLKASGKITPAKEYVRASSPPEQPNTLLRAAQPSADTAQEQLLRPTQE